MAQHSLFIDIDSTDLTAEDREVLQHPLVGGVILFTRNYTHLEQLTELCHSIYSVNSSLFIAVDQEGGRIQRFQKDFPQLPPPQYWGERFRACPGLVVDELQQSYNRMLFTLQRAGVTMSLIPVLDLDYQRSTVLNQRCFDSEPAVVSYLGGLLCKTMHLNNMPTAAKHFPGHGYAVADSHLELPHDHRNFKEIWQNDLLPYRELISLLDIIMPAHIVFDAVDESIVTFSKYWLQEVLRGMLGYQGVIMSDCMSMQATFCQNPVDRVMAAWEAGCDIVTFCNSRDQVLTILDNIPHHLQVAINPVLEAFRQNYCLNQGVIL